MYLITTTKDGAEMWEWYDMCPKDIVRMHRDMSQMDANGVDYKVAELA